MHGLLTGHPILVEAGRMQAIPQHAAGNRIAAVDKTMAAVDMAAATTTSNRKLQQHVAEHTNSATLRFRKQSFPLNSGR